MKRLPAILIPLLLAGCALGTDPWELTLADLSDPPPNHATILVTADLHDDGGFPALGAGLQYFFTLRLPPQLPELVYDTDIGVAVVRLGLGDVTRTGLRLTGSDDVAFLFGAPGGELFQPITSCRITVTSPWTEEPGSRLQGMTDCPVTDGFRALRVLVKFDHTP